MQLQYFGTRLADIRMYLAGSRCLVRNQIGAPSVLFPNAKVSLELPSGNGLALRKQYLIALSHFCFFSLKVDFQNGNIFVVMEIPCTLKNFTELQKIEITCNSPPQDDGDDDKLLQLALVVS